MFLKIAVMNNSGNVGKSMICQNLLSPRIPNAGVIKVETNNSDGTTDKKVSAKEVDEIFSQLDSHDTCIIDVGSSNIETFMSNFEKIEGSIEDIDYFFLPTTPVQKQQVDTISTIHKLLELDVNINQIKIVFNFYNPDLNIERQYPVIFENPVTKKMKLDNVDHQFIIEESELFNYLGQTGFSYSEILSDERDFKTLIRATQDKDERNALSLERMTQRFVNGFDKKLNFTFNKIAKACDINLTE
jgi:hypothetical protein